MDITTEIYRITKLFPESERYGLISQMNRAAVSIVSNIAEGAGRNSNKEFVQFLAHSHASSYELETQLILCKRLEYISLPDFDQISQDIEEFQKMGYAFAK